MKRTLALTGFNIGTSFTDEMKPLAKVLEDPIKFVDVLYAVCKPQADEAGLSDEMFGECLVGDCLTSAVDALLEALADFFPKRQGALLKRMFSKMRQMQNTLAEHAEKELDQLMSTSSASSLPG